MKSISLDHSKRRVLLLQVVVSSSLLPSTPRSVRRPLQGRLLQDVVQFFERVS